MGPWLFFQLNSNYFNEQKGLYSKLDTDTLIPDQFRLNQKRDDGKTFPEKFPIFFKPEWGQNSHGVTRIDNREMLSKVRKHSTTSKTPFIIQEAARESREFEIFYIRSSQNFDEYATLSITEVVNNGCSKTLPINGIHNPLSLYTDITNTFSKNEQDSIWNLIQGIGKFPIARVGLRTNGKEQFLNAKFHIIEINIFLPMPLYLLDKCITFKNKYLFIIHSMAATAEITKNIPASQPRKAIFFRKLKAHYRIKS